MGLLDGDLADILTDALGETIFLPSVIYRTTKTYLPGGKLVVASVPLPCRGFVDRASFTMRTAAGFIEGSVRVLILRQTVPGMALNTDDEFTCLAGQYSGVRWKLSGKDGDPAGATFDMVGVTA